jgi:signal transduction histidine kinase
MVLVGLLLSERVLAGLADTQERHLRDLAQSYLDGLPSAVAPSILREDIWEIFEAVERAQELHRGLRPTETVVTDAEGLVLAASDPRRHPLGSTFGTRQQAQASPDRSFSFQAGADAASALRKLSYPGRTIGVIHAAFDTSHLAAERRKVILKLAATNGALTLLLAAGGWLLVARMMRPVRILTEHLAKARSAQAAPIAAEVVARHPGEFGRLFGAYNALVQSMDEREALARKLAEEERLVSLGRLTSSLAHEINNPLGGLFNALATLKSHGHHASVRGNAIGLLDRGLVGIRDIVRTTLAVYRTDRRPRDLTAADIDDLQLLIMPEARRKAVRISITNEIVGSMPLPSTPVRQAILNVLLNALAASPAGAGILLSARPVGANLIVTVTDRGAGLPEEGANVLAGAVPAAPLADGGGLGLWTTSRIVADLGGTIEVERPLEGGTVVRLTVPFAKAEELPLVA